MAMIENEAYLAVKYTSGWYNPYKPGTPENEAYARGASRALNDQ